MNIGFKKFCNTSAIIGYRSEITCKFYFLPEKNKAPNSSNWNVFYIANNGRYFQTFKILI